jgi:uncharacterized membrane protein YkvA (DUF1232 family)
MAAASEHLERMRAWIDSFPADVAAVQRLVDDEKASTEARLLGAAAVNYLVTRLDLIPDWEEACGILDDAMVLRVAMALIAEPDLDPLDVGVHRLANEAEGVQAFLGPDLYPRFKHYVRELGHAVVRARAPRVIVDDARQRKALWSEVEDELKRVPPAPIRDPDRIARVVRNYLSQKLK